MGSEKVDPAATIRRPSNRRFLFAGHAGSAAKNQRK
jgi:hypothetical protein